MRNRGDEDDSEEVYESDFEDESYKQEEDDIEESGSNYFLDYETKFNNKNSAKKLKRQEMIKKKEEEIPNNPLMATNKYYFLKQDLQKEIRSICSELTSKDQIEI
jgi:hypothetical protein